MANGISEQNYLQAPSFIIGDKAHQIVLESLGKIWVRYGNGYKEFTEILNSISKATTSAGKIIIEEDTLKDPGYYKNGSLVYAVQRDILYLVYQGQFLILAEALGSADSGKYVYKTGDTMTGPLTIKTQGAPLNVTSREFVPNLNVNFLGGLSRDDFAVKWQDETILGNYTFEGNDIFNGQNTFNALTTFNATALFTNTVGAAIRVGQGNIITDGSIGSSQFMSGFTGYGWRMDADTNTLTVDNLIVRGILQVYELVVNKISATNGSLWVTDSFQIEKTYKAHIIDVSKTSPLEFKENEFYIPITSEVTEIGDFDNTIDGEEEKESWATDGINKWRLSSKEGELSTRSQYFPTASEAYKYTYCGYKWIFQILNIAKFKEALGVGTIPISDYVDALQKSFRVSAAADRGSSWTKTEGQITVDIRDGNDLTYSYTQTYGDLALPPGLVVMSLQIYVVKPEDSDICKFYFKIKNDSGPGPLYKAVREAINIEISEEIPEEAVAFNRIPMSGIFVESSSATGNVELLASKQTLKDLHAASIIELANIYQKRTTRADEDEIIISIGQDAETGETKEFQHPIRPLNPDFFTQKFPIITDATLYNTKEYFGNQIAYVNLYLKYFGYQHKAGVNDDSQDIFILEAKDSEYPVFHPGDILKCQKFTGKSVKQYHMIVLGLIGSYGFIAQKAYNTVLNQKTVYSYDEDGNLINSDTSIDTALYERSESVEQGLALDGDAPLNMLEQDNEKDSLTGSDDEKAAELVATKTTGDPEKDDALVRIGSIFMGTRQNSLYMTSSEDYSPYQDVMTGVNRPDYNVVYFTPKYVMQDAAYTDINGIVRRGKMYAQDETFSQNFEGDEEFKKQYEGIVVNYKEPEGEKVFLTIVDNGRLIYGTNKAPLTVTKSTGTFYVTKEETKVFPQFTGSSNVEYEDPNAKFEILLGNRQDKG